MLTRYNDAVISEKTVCGIWQSPIANDLLTDKGERFRKIYAGREISGPGCDFQDAIFSIDGQIMLGDVEVHVDAREWYLHGHHKDERYNNVALHVVMWHSGGIPTVLANGRVIPTVSLNILLEDVFTSQEPEATPGGAQIKVCTCRLVQEGKSQRDLLPVLEQCGLERFMARVENFKSYLTTEDAGQVLYRGMMGALGYSRNTVTSENLAGRMPLKSLESELADGYEGLLALMLGTAGFLTEGNGKSKKVKNIDMEMLAQLWNESGREPAMQSQEWCLYGIRPGNHPVRRIAAMVELLLRFKEYGLLDSICELVRGAPSTNYRLHLEDGLIVSGAGQSGDKFKPALLGRSRAGEIVINVILPFMYAYAGAIGERPLAIKARKMFLDYPPTEENYITRLMIRNLGMVYGGACIQQGLLYIFKTHCRYRDCTGCPVGNLKKL